MNIWNEKKKIEFTILGFVCCDIFEEEKREEIGGSAGNVATILNNLGQNVSLWFPKYSDIRGESIYKKLIVNGIKVIDFTTTRLQMPYVCMEYDTIYKRQRLISFDGKKRIVSKVCLPTETQVKRRIDILNENSFLFTDRMSEGIHLAIRTVQAMKGWVFYEPNGCRTYDTFAGAVKKADIVKFSTEKIFEKYIEMLKQDIVDSKIRIIIVTEGEKGVKFCFRNEEKFSDWIKIEAHKIEVIDSIGAGDWLSACFILLFGYEYPNNKNIFLEERILIKILYTAARVAEISCKYRGCYDFVKEKEMLLEIERIYNEFK